MKTAIIIGLSVFILVNTVPGLSPFVERKATVQVADPKQNGSPVILELKDASRCKFTGSLFMETTRGKSDIFPHTQWVMGINRKLCPSLEGEMASNVNWEVRLTEAPRNGDSLDVPDRL